MRVLSALLLFVLLQVTAAPLCAQKSGIVGTVSDTLGNALGGVQVELSGTDYGSITNVSGEFRLTKVKPGPYTIYMRRIGFEAIAMPINISSGDPMELDFELTPSILRLAVIPVKAAAVSQKLLRVGFVDRLKTSGVPPSRFITRAEIEKRNPISLTHLLESKGGRVRNCVDASVWIDGLPPIVAEQQTAAPAGGILGRNSSLRGMPRTENNNPMRYRPLESIPVKVVEGMEVFASISEVPIEFRAGGNMAVNGKCVILIWTRDGRG
ncbi:MAG: carboxypeptidase-like regulatory domain-containing protein [Gemmatimonadaceae bacterium]